MARIFQQMVARPDSRQIARQLEEQGFDGVSFVDSQNLSGDVYVAMTTAVLATEVLHVSSGVTNPVTRHPAVTAGAAASVNRLAAGRVQLGIGRGDSALAHLGRAPARVKDFERYLSTLQAYLRGEEIPFDVLDFAESLAPPVDELELADTAGTSQIFWLPGSAGKVPVEVSATGPKVIGAAARHAERIMFALGAAPERIAWGIDIARSARSDAGLDPDYLAYGAYVNVVCHGDLDRARDLVRGGLSTFARFSVMHGEVIGPVSESERNVMGKLHDNYDMNSHTRADSQQAAVLTPEFIDSYAIVGGPDVCVERIRALTDLGLDKLIFVGATMGSNREIASESDALIRDEVLPNCRN
ncbi:MAG TPA: LLM class flavin-dependent oxidoreductase [Acidimicrobiia bacterium]|jgi:5,10-methylenetetrahydromethanopterin reductase|nr:LLM class flavin-dependent oxidoreductase [Acidimicrobiia bacterium]